MEPAGIEQTPDELRQALADWAYHAGQRDELVRAAYEAGITIKEISELARLSRPTVYKILGREPGDR